MDEGGPSGMDRGALLFCMWRDAVGWDGMGMRWWVVDLRPPLLFQGGIKREIRVGSKGK